MKIIAEVIDDIYCTKREAEKYLDKAVKYKEEFPKVSSMYYNTYETHRNLIDSMHDVIVALITEQRKKETPPKYMQDIWDYQHKQIIDEVAYLDKREQMYKK